MSRNELVEPIADAFVLGWVSIAMHTTSTRRLFIPRPQGRRRCRPDLVFAARARDRAEGARPWHALPAKGGDDGTNDLIVSECHPPQ